MNSLIDQLADVDTDKSYKISGTRINLWNSLWRAMWRGENLITVAPMTKSQQGSAGCSLGVGIGDSIFALFAPFQVLTSQPSGGSSFVVRLQPGSVNGFLFPKILGIPMWQLVPNTVEGITTYAFPTLSVNKGDAIYLSGTVTAGVITILDLISGPAPTTDDDSNTYLILATCDPTTGAIIQVVTGNQVYAAVASYWNAGARLVQHVWGPLATS